MKKQYIYLTNRVLQAVTAGKITAQEGREMLDEVLRNFKSLNVKKPR